MKTYEFLAKCRATFNLIAKNENEIINFVIGNQSADLDSIISSISVAYYKYLKLNEIKYLPVLNTTKEIINKKDECKYLFEYHQINTNDLIYLNELVTDNKHLKFLNSKFFLVDHNKLDDYEMSLGIDKRVCGVIDHHKDENLYTNMSQTEATSPIRVIDNTIASNCLLITELFSNENHELDSTFATLLLFAVLEDTANMSSERARKTAKDDTLFEYLFNKSCLNRDQLNNMYNKIRDFKINNANNKTIEEILLNDYKQWSFNSTQSTSLYGISSCIINPNKWIQKETLQKWLNEIESFIMTKNLNLFFILVVFNHETDTNKYNRDLLIFSDNQTTNSFINYSLNKTELQVKQQFKLNESLNCVWFNTFDEKKSRKFWQPLIESFLNDTNK